MSPEVRDELFRLLSDLCDGELADAGHDRLAELLAADPECRLLYLEYVDQHARLLVHPSVGLPARRSEEVAPAARPRGHGPSWLRYGLVVGATLAASLLLQFALLPRRAPDGERGPDPEPAETRPADYVATLTQTAACVWEGPAESRYSGGRLTRGELRLRQGAANVRFDGGVELLLQGPAALHLDSGTAATLLHGRVVFRADKTSAPFDLRTPSSTLVDFGTEYAVSVGPEGEEVHVFDGEVQRTPRPAGGAEPEHLKAGQARRYGVSSAAPGKPTALTPARFLRQVAAPDRPAADALLAYEGFDYADAETLQAGKAAGGLGWDGPWMPGFARPLGGEPVRPVLDVARSLTRPRAAPAGGSFGYAGFTKYFRRLAAPVRLDADGVYYLSFLVRRDGPTDHETNAVAVLLWTAEEYRLMPDNRDDQRKRLNVGVRGWNQLFTQLHDMASRTPLPLHYGETYLLVAKVVASESNPDQVFMRVYPPEQPVEPDEPGDWTVVSPPFLSDLAFDWLQLHINSDRRQTIDEVRLGTTWASVAGPWLGPRAGPEGRR